MRRILIVANLALLFSCASDSSQLVSIQSTNPLFPEINQLIQFDKVTAKDFEASIQTTKDFCNQKLELLVGVDLDQRTFDNTMIILDDIYHQVIGIRDIADLVAVTHPDSAVRNAAIEVQTSMNQYMTEVRLDDRVFAAVSEYSQTEDANQLTGPRAKFVGDQIDYFERNGFGLSPDKRKTLKTIRDEISTLGSTFDNNVAGSYDFLMLSESDLVGLPDDYKQPRKQEDGNYKVDMSYPSYGPVMTYAQSEQTRKDLYKKFRNRAAPDNLNVLTDLIRKRSEMAALLGFESFADYRTSDRMAGSAKAVWDFERDLTAKIRPKALTDYQEMVDLREKTAPGEGPVEINPWDISYYENILFETKYDLDQELVKQYFPLNNVLDGLFQITQKLFDLEYREVQNPSTWHPEVRLFELYMSGELKGHFYLDLHPRPNKYSHAACFSIVTGKKFNDHYQLPSASLVCNFTPPSGDKPSILYHSEVETLFHEFGHVLHFVLGQTDLHEQSSFSVSQDFVEAPSQIFENWTWDYKALSLFARHYETGETLPQQLFDKMLAARNVNSGVNTLGQIFLGTYDLTLYDQFDPDGEKTTTDVNRELYNDTMPYQFVEGAHFEAAFGHLNSYGAGYYGYLWSKVYAQDMFSKFRKKGIMDPDVGRQYRDIILAPGDSRDELELVQEFLGRDANSDAFLQSIGL